MNDPEKRICPYCAEVINARAKLCPRCRQWLTLRSFRHPVVMTLTHVLPAFAFGLGFLWAVSSLLDNLGNPKPYYSEFPDSLGILDSRINWAQTRDGLRIFVAGVVTNSSPIAWSGTEFDCRFFDTTGVMVDADTGYGRVTVQPHTEAAFRVSINPTALTNKYATYRISVSHARNAKGWY